MSEPVPTTPIDIDALRQRALDGTLTLEDSMKFIEATRAGFLARPNPTAKKQPPPESVDYF